MCRDTETDFTKQVVLNNPLKELAVEYLEDDGTGTLQRTVTGILLPLGAGLEMSANPLGNGITGSLMEIPILRPEIIGHQALCFQPITVVPPPGTVAGNRRNEDISMGVHKLLL